MGAREMARLVLTAVVGAIIGISGAVYLGGASNDGFAPGARYGFADVEVGPREIASLIERDLGVADRAAVYEFASRAAPPALSASIEEIARRPRSPERTFLIGVFLTRIAEEDAGAALELLRELALDPATTRALALQVIAAMGTSEDTLDTVLVALPGMDARRFRVDAVAELAGADPDRALELALAMSEQVRGDAVRAVANVWGENDPYSALAQAESIVDADLKLAFVDRTLRQLARTDLMGAVAFVNGRYTASDREYPRLMQAIGQESLQLDPMAALDVARQIGGRFGMNIERQAVERWARENPLAAFAYAQGLPPSGQRQSLRETVALAYGARDPDAALAWARSLQPTSRDVMSAVLAGIARADPMRAIDHMEAEGPSGDPYLGGAFRLVVGALQNTATPRVPPAAIADRLLAIDGGQRDNIASMFLDYWANQDIDAALDWLLVNIERVPDRAYSQLAQRLAESDPSEALRRANRLPPERRDEWIRGAVVSMARRDPAGAVQWVAEFRGQSVYDTTATAVIQAAAYANPEQALTLFDSLSQQGRIDAAESVGAAWVQQDIHAARDWIHRMQAGPVRDAALKGFMSGMREEPPDAATLSLFSTDGARQEAVVRILDRVARRDQAEAVRLMDQYITDPELRQRAGLALVRASR